MNIILGLSEWRETQYFSLRRQETIFTEVPYLDQEPHLSRRQWRIKICSEARSCLVRWLRQRIPEIVQESDQNPRGVVTILSWLENDVGRYDAIIGAIAAVDDALVSELRIDAVGEILQDLLFTAKAVLYSGQAPAMGDRNSFKFVARAEEHKVVAGNYNLGGVTGEEFRNRFLLVAKHVQQAATIIDGLWSESTDES